MPIDPFSTNQVEVIRGPAALRYGSTSIGGVVSATNNRIPDALPTCPAAPFRSYGLPVKAPLADAQSSSCMNVETRTAVSSVDRGVEGGILLDAGGNNVAVHADAYGRKTSDYNIPSYPYLFDQTRPVNGRQPNSAAQRTARRSAAPISSRTVSSAQPITQNDALYRIPGIDGADHQTRIDAHQTKFTAKGEYRPHAEAIDAVRFWTGVTDYHHNEIGLADPADPATDGVRQIFTNKEQEGRVEVQMMPFNARFAAVTTAFGLQAGHQELTAPSPDDPSSPFNGCGTQTVTTGSPATSSTSSNSAKRPRLKSPAASSTSSSTARRRNFPDFLPNSNPARSACIARNPSFHAEERQRRPDPESAL